MRLFRVAPLALIAASMLSAPAFAQEAEEEEAGPIEISANVALTSDYRFRGVSFSDEDIAIQGGFDVSHSSGFYIGTWASSLEDSPLYGNAELDVYAGWSGDVAPNITLDGGVLYYIYPNGDDTVGDSDYFEPYASVTAALGPVEATVGAAYAPEQGSALTSDNIYVYGDLGTGIPDTPISLAAHLGYSEGSLDYGSGGYLDWSLGASVSYKILELGVAYVDTDLPEIAGQDAAVVFTVGASF
ncbi:TorF family putative porin [Citromicrobium bathyomarinum]|uniref:TorF family putative porin n=1 Tax=Citromicrobium bathyomarinum TaxID=72174 RepID=UPI00315A6D2E